jgi:hypothetical protein
MYVEFSVNTKMMSVRLEIFRRRRLHPPSSPLRQKQEIADLYYMYFR